MNVNRGGDWETYISLQIYQKLKIHTKILSLVTLKRELFDFHKEHTAHLEKIREHQTKTNKKTSHEFNVQEFIYNMSIFDAHTNFHTIGSRIE